MSAWGFAISEGLKSLWRYRFVAILSVITISVAIFVFSLFLLITFNLNAFLKAAQSRLSIEVFLDDNLSIAKINSLMSGLRRLPGVRSVEFVDKEAARKRFEKRFGRTVAVSADENPFPRSILVKLTPGAYIKESAKRALDFVKGKKGVVQVIAPGEVFEKVSGLFKTFIIISVIWGVILLLGAIVIIVNTIKLAIFGRKDIINIMRVVGATDDFIRRPFIFEGFVQGALAALVSLAMLRLAFVGAKFLVPSLVNLPNWMAAGVVVLGILLGVSGSSIALRKFLSTG